MSETLRYRDRIFLSCDSWECVHFRDPAERGFLGHVHARSFYVASIDGEALASDAALIEALGQAMRFPAYSGQNWDAVADSLGDLDWLDAPGYLLIIEDVDRHGLSPALGKLLEIWPFPAQEWSERDKKPFHLVGFYSDPPESAPSVRPGDRSGA